MRISCGASHTLFIDNRGAVYAFGDNYYSQFGIKNDTLLSSSVPILIPFPEIVTAVSCGDSHSAVIFKSGKLCTFGNNEYSQLGSCKGLVTCPHQYPRLQHFLGAEKAIAVSCGYNHTVVIAKGGNLYSFGDNSRGQLGIGNADTDEHKFPLLIALPAPAIKVSCGGNQTAVITKGGNLYTFGANSTGQLGVGDEYDRTYPTLVSFNEELIDVSCGEHHMGVITKSSKIYMFGYGKEGQLGAVSSSSSLPLLLENTQVLPAQIACGVFTTNLLSTSGALYTFGLSLYGLEEDKTSKLRRVPFNEVIVSMSASDQEAFITSGGDLYISGFNDKYKKLLF